MRRPWKRRRHRGDRGGAGTGAGGSSGGSGSGSGSGSGGNEARPETAARTRAAAGVRTQTGSGGANVTDGGVIIPSSTLAAADPCTGGSTPGPRKLWRLTAPEFAASIHTIFGDTANAAPVATVFSDPAVLGFSVDANALLVQDLNASQLEDNAEAIAAWAASAGKLAQFASCAATSRRAGGELRDLVHPGVRRRPPSGPRSPPAIRESAATAACSWRAAPTRTARRRSSRRCCSHRTSFIAASSASRAGTRSA